jgi:hypothetical protein
MAGLSVANFKESDLEQIKEEAQRIVAGIQNIQ